MRPRPNLEIPGRGEALCASAFDAVTGEERVQLGLRGGDLRRLVGVGVAFDGVIDELDQVAQHQRGHRHGQLDADRAIPVVGIDQRETAEVEVANAVGRLLGGEDPKLVDAGLVLVEHDVETGAEVVLDDDRHVAVRLDELLGGRPHLVQELLHLRLVGPLREAVDQRVDVGDRHDAEAHDHRQQRVVPVGDQGHRGGEQHHQATQREEDGEQAVEVQTGLAVADFFQVAHLALLSTSSPVGLRGDMRRCKSNPIIA